MGLNAPYTVSRRADACLTQHPIIGQYPPVMLNPCDHVHSLAVRIDVAGRLETGEKKRLEQR
jgi:hypothetical protein